MFWRHLPEAQNAFSVNPRDGCSKAAIADGELAERAKTQTDDGVGVGSVLRAIFQEFCLDWPHFAGLGVAELMVEVSGRLEVIFVYLRRSLFDRKCPTVVEIARHEVLVVTATGQGLEVAQGLDKVK